MSLFGVPPSRSPRPIPTAAAPRRNATITPAQTSTGGDRGPDGAGGSSSSIIVAPSTLVKAASADRRSAEGEPAAGLPCFDPGRRRKSAPPRSCRRKLYFPWIYLADEEFRRRSTSAAHNSPELPASR